MPLCLPTEMYAFLTEPRLREIQNEYVEILERSDYPDPNYRERIRTMIDGREQRLVVDIGHLREMAPKRVPLLIENACEELLCLQEALKRVATSVDPSLSENDIDSFTIGIGGALGEYCLSPRTLVSSYLGSLICVEGIVTKCSLVCPKLMKSVHYCPVTKKVVQKVHADNSSLEQTSGFVVYPTKDDEGNLYETEYGLCRYQNYQTFMIQEMPENAPPGQLPRSVDVIAEGDLVDQCKAGERIRVTGVYRSVPQSKSPIANTFFKNTLVANFIQRVTNDVAEQLDADDVKLIRTFAKDHNYEVFNILARSLAPSIQGHAHVKKAILCMILGGVEKNLENGTRLRGDINLMLIGDPSVAKSQLLRYVLHVAPIGVCTTGRGSSGVGLTATVTSDPDTGERRLEGGAMVIADRGIVCIDEFDKMTDIDRTAIHEVMEQGRVTISKAGIHATLNARCSVLAAANPIYGRYDIYKTPMENIGLPDSLLSRFDVIFVMLDKVNSDVDREIASHVLKIHQFRPSNDAGVRKNLKKDDVKFVRRPEFLIHAVDRTRLAYEVDDDEEELPESPSRDPEQSAPAQTGTQNPAEVAPPKPSSSQPAAGLKKSATRKGKTAASSTEPTASSGKPKSEREKMEELIYEKDETMKDASKSERERKIVRVEFFKKYVKLARSIKPEITKEAANAISAEFVRLRNLDIASGAKKIARTQPITARTLETLIRLATAFAKCRLNRYVTESDAKAAIALVTEAIFEEVAPKPKRNRPQDEKNPPFELQSDLPTDKSAKRVREDDAMDVDSEEEEVIITGEPSQEIRDAFRIALSSMFRQARNAPLDKSEIVAHMKTLSEQGQIPRLNQTTIDWILTKMEEESMIMVSEAQVFMI